MNQELEIQRIKGRYKTICVTITAFATVIAAVIGGIFGAKYAPIEVNVNLNDYISKAQDEMMSQQTPTDEAMMNSLRENITKLQETNVAQAEQIAALEKEKEALRNVIAEKDRQINALEASPPSDSTSFNSDLKTEKTIKLTSLTLLGNNQSAINFVYNSLENSDDAKSNLGEPFNSSISMRRNGNIDFYLGGSYKTFDSTICISESTKSIDGYSSTLSIYKVEGNGSNEELEILYSSPELTMGFIPTKIGPIDVSGVEHLRISFYADGYYGNVPRIILGNPILEPQ